MRRTDSPGAVTPAQLPAEFELYAGSWIALVRGRIVASGATAHETWLNCRAARAKDEPILRFIPKAVSPEIARPANKSRGPLLRSPSVP